MKEKIEIIYIDKNVRQKKEIYAVAEKSLALFVNGIHSVDFLYTPGDEKDLIVGHCLTSGWIKGRDDIASLEIDNGRAEVVLNNVTGGRDAERRSNYPGLCDDEIKMMEADMRVAPGELTAMLTEMESAQELGKTTKASHAISLFASDGRMVVVREDAGRHNAFDKVIGFALMQGEDFSDMIAVLSSRISYEMALKAYRAGIQIMAGVSAATALAVKLGRTVDLTIAGRLSGDSMLIYSGEHRIN